MSQKKASLILQNGQILKGRSFGYDGPTSGEVVFSTAMVGYPESLTDPSYSGQILCVSYPLIGNYGIPSRELAPDGLSLNFESEKIHVRGLIISDYSEKYSHWDATMSLDEWMKAEKIPGIYGIDTRELTKTLREEGAMLGKIVPEGSEAEDIAYYDPDKENQVALVSCKEPIRYGNGKKRVALLDCGVKHHILRCLISRGVELIRLPWDYDFNTMDWDGLFISNGPGNPTHCETAIKNIAKALQGDRPVFGICMGNQLMSLAAGAGIFKLKYGHRSHNQPVRMCGTEKCFVTSQNHGYAVDDSKLGADWEASFTNMNDGTNEGIRHLTKPFFSTQFHPEASSGPVDTEFLFDKFISTL